jgi:hypothetical protein
VLVLSHGALYPSPGRVLSVLYLARAVLDVLPQDAIVLLVHADGLLDGAGLAYVRTCEGERRSKGHSQ